MLLSRQEPAAFRNTSKFMFKSGRGKQIEYQKGEIIREIRRDMRQRLKE